MKLSINKSSLMSVLKLVKPATNSRATLPVLAHVKLEADKEGLFTAAATNLEIAIQANAIARVAEPGEICTPFQRLADLVSVATEEEVTFESNEIALQVRWGKSRTKLPVLSTEEFPPMPTFVFEGAEVDGGKFKQTIHQLAFAASTEEARPTMMGMNFTEKSVQATDSYRLAFKYADFGIRGLIPAAAVKLAAGMAGSDESIRVRSTDEKIIFTGAGWQLTTQKIDGNYPEVMMIVPKSHKTAIRVSTADLRAALSQMRTVQWDRIDVASGEGILSIETQAADDGSDTRAEIPAIIEGDPQAFSVNGAYFAESVSAIGGKDVMLYLTTPRSPILIAGDDPDCKHVIMPMHKG